VNNKNNKEKISKRVCGTSMEYKSLPGRDLFYLIFFLGGGSQLQYVTLNRTVWSVVVVESLMGVHRNTDYELAKKSCTCIVTGADSCRSMIRKSHLKNSGRIWPAGKAR
jgi:hypothetical protein